MSGMLVLEDGSVFEGKSIGIQGTVVGEVVFHTAMTGYQEILTDPSYASQIITMTYPHIGNVGVHPDDEESAQVYAKGLIIRDLSLSHSHWRAQESLPEYLTRQSVVALAEVDTRELTHRIRKKGALRACLTTEALTVEEALEKARAFSGLSGLDLTDEVTVQKTFSFTEGIWRRGWGHPTKKADELPRHLVVYDFGVKRNILRCLVELGCRLTVVPAHTSAEKALSLNPDGIVLSNGPGDPAACEYAIETIQQLMEAKIPMLGICLGQQLLGLACGGKTVKMSVGHHGANHPVRTPEGAVLITSQNHGFTVDLASLPECLIPTYISLFDGTLQGFEHRTLPIVSVQGHPEASPGPHDWQRVFSEFLTRLSR